MTTSLTDTSQEDGRKDHAYTAGKYWLPPSIDEFNRLDLQHQVWTLTLGGLYRAPIDGHEITKALDIGAGTGIWAAQFADQHPSCSVIGSDLTPVQRNDVPSNCEFLVHDIESDQWSFPPMDYIHSRMLVAGVRDWKRVLQRSYENLKPGGWMELTELESPFFCPDGSADENDALMRWSILLPEASGKVGCDFQIRNKLKAYLEETGFVNITREDYQWPIGPWPENKHLAAIGQLMLANIRGITESCRPLLKRELGWTSEEDENFFAQCLESIQDKTKHRYIGNSVYYAQKPALDHQSSHTSSETLKEI